MESFGFWFFVNDVIIGVSLRIFGRGHRAIGAKPTSHFLTQMFLETRLQSESLEGVIDFLVLLVPT